jgi:hypothetical protein
VQRRRFGRSLQSQSQPRLGQFDAVEHGRRAVRHARRDGSDRTRQPRSGHSQRLAVEHERSSARIRRTTTSNTSTMRPARSSDAKSRATSSPAVPARRSRATRQTIT